MLSERQLAANRQNTQKSTGPRMPEGKSVCAPNALPSVGTGPDLSPQCTTQKSANRQHAKLADEVLLACEDRRQFIRLSRRYHREFQPVGHLEKSLVNDMVAASWRRDRLGILEARLIDHSYNTIPEPLLPQPDPEAAAPHPDHSPVAFRNALGYRELVDTSKVLPQLSRDAARHNRDFHKALATLLRLRATQAEIQSRPESEGSPEDPYYQGRYDRPVIPPPADPLGTVSEGYLGLFGSVSAPEPLQTEAHKQPERSTESTICECDPVVAVLVSVRSARAAGRGARGRRNHPSSRVRRRDLREFVKSARAAGLGARGHRNHPSSRVRRRDWRGFLKSSSHTHRPCLGRLRAAGRIKSQRTWSSPARVRPGSGLLGTEVERAVHIGPRGMPAQPTRSLK